MKNKSPLHLAARIAFITSFFILLAKFFAFSITGSKAVLSDAIESIINVVTGAFVLYSINISTQPADKDHPYGHGKIEAFSAGLEGGLIILASIMILVEAMPGFFNPQAPTNLNYGIAILFGAGIVNMLVGLYLLHSGKKLKSEALQADGYHLLTDFYTSAGVLVGLVLVRLSGWLWLDPLVACLVAVNIMIPGLKLVSKAVKNLMDEADPELLDRIVKALNQSKKTGWLYPHKLRAIRSGRYHHIDMHIALPYYWSLERVHAAQKEITDTLLADIGEEGDIMVHIDPCEPPYCPCCDLEPCPERAHEIKSTETWTVRSVTSPRPGSN